MQDLTQVEPWMWVAAPVTLLLVIVAVAWLALRRRRRSARLQEVFGPEYRDALEEAGGRREGEAELEERLELRQSLQIRPLTPEAVRRHREAWRRVQLRFVDAPTEAVRDAERLTREAMEERGYPVGDVEARTAALSVDYPHLARRYRQVHDLDLDPEQDPLPTEELRQALLDYRLLLEELLEVQEDAAPEEAEAAPAVP